MYPTMSLITKSYEAPLFASILFVVLASPVTFQLVNDILAAPLGLKTVRGGIPTKFGVVLHALVFFLISLLFLKNK